LKNGGETNNNYNSKTSGERHLRISGNPETTFPAPSKLRLPVKRIFEKREKGEAVTRFD
jgi:hypothetical protein